MKYKNTYFLAGTFLLIPMVLSSCMHIQPQGPIGVQGIPNMSKDLVITWPGWFSEEEKLTSFKAVAEKKAFEKCQGGEFKIVDLYSTRVQYKPLTNNAISANIQCSRDQIVATPTPLVSQPPEKDITSSTTNKNLAINKLRTRCVELGFKSGTEDFGKCVLQLSK
jgi:hypothetical protein